jgi:hypothetical protein
VLDLAAEVQADLVLVVLEELEHLVQTSVAVAVLGF